MHIKNSVLLILILLMTYCKSADTGQAGSNQKSTNLILLLAEGTSPADLETVKSIGVESMKRISKSQNKWVVEIAESNDINALMAAIKEETQVVEVSIDEKSQKSDLSKNERSGKSDPIKN